MGQPDRFSTDFTLARHRVKLSTLLSHKKICCVSLWLAIILCFFFLHPFVPCKSKIDSRSTDTADVSDMD